MPTFTGAFNSTAPSIDPFQSSDGFTTTSPFIVIGNSPLVGGTTQVPANLTAISLQLLNPDGSTFANVPFAPFEQLTLNSPNLQNAPYSVGGTQFGDAVQRAEFFNTKKPNWHTLLNPSIANRYFPSTASDGSTVVFMLDLLFSFLDFLARL